METTAKKRVAIVGSGMAGLVTAYLLKSHYQVTVFECGSQPSLDAASITVANEDTSQTDRVDLPMRAFAGGYYRSLIRLYDHIGIEYHAQRFQYHFSHVDKRWTGSSKECGSASFIHTSNNHRMPPPRPRNAGWLKWAFEAAYLLVVYAYLTFCCRFVQPQADERHSESLRKYLERIRLPRYFRSNYLLPLISSVSTCSHGTLLDFPAIDIVDYKKITHGSQHYVVAGGVNAVQERLRENVDIELLRRVVSVESRGSKVDVRWEGKSSGAESFDYVVLAVSPNIVGSIFKPLAQDMAKIPTVSVESIVSKGSLIDGSDLADAQLIHLRTRTEGAHQTESVHVQPSGKVVTTCPFTSIDATDIIQTARFTRVLRTPESRAVVNKIFQSGIAMSEKSSWRNGDGGVWLAGGWCWDGMVLLEGCVVSAVRVAHALGVRAPWS